MLLDDFSHEFQFSERHATTVMATPEEVMRAVREVRPAEVRLLRELFGLRGLALGGTERRAGDRPLLEWIGAAGFVTLAESPDEVVLGIIGQFWRLTARPHTVADADEFIAFSRRDHAKAAMNLRVTGRAEGPVELVTETRVTIPDPASRRRFALYWAVIRPGSGLIRHTLLRAVRRHAEAAARGRSHHPKR